MKEIILQILKNRNIPIKRFDLRTALIDSGINTTDRAMRREIELIITRDGECIESSERGYMLIRDGNQLNRAMNYLNSKSVALAVRKNYLIHNFFKKQKNKKNEKQCKIEFVE